MVTVEAAEELLATNINELSFEQRHQLFDNLLSPLSEPLLRKFSVEEWKRPVLDLVVSIPWYFPTASNLPTSDWVAYKQSKRWPWWNIDFDSPAKDMERAGQGQAVLLEDICTSIQNLVAKAIFLNLCQKSLESFTKGASTEPMAKSLLRDAFRMERVSKLIENIQNEPGKDLQDYVLSEDYVYGPQGEANNSSNNPWWTPSDSEPYYWPWTFSPLHPATSWLKSLLWVRLYYEYFRYSSEDPDHRQQVAKFVEPLTQFGLAFSYGHIPVAMVDGKLWLIQRVRE